MGGESVEMETQEGAPVHGSPDGSTNSSDGDVLSGTVESTQVEADQPTAQTDISFNVAIIFVLSMIVGLVIYHILSRRWQT